jgi:hypothetical protein
MWKTITATLIAVLLSGAAHAQTCLTDPVFGAQRNAYGPGVHMDATGRAYRDTPSNARVFARTPTVPVSAATRSGASGRADVRPARPPHALGLRAASGGGPRRRAAGPVRGHHPSGLRS